METETEIDFKKILNCKGIGHHEKTINRKIRALNSQIYEIKNDPKLTPIQKYEKKEEILQYIEKIELAKKALANHKKNFIKEMENKHLLIIDAEDEEWLNSPVNFNDTRLTLLCNKCEKTFKRTLYELRKVPACLFCVKKNSIKNRTLRLKQKHEEIIEKVLTAYPKAKLISKITGKADEPVSFICENGNVFNSTVNKIAPAKFKTSDRGHWCKCEQCKKEGNKFQKLMTERTKESTYELQYQSHVDVLHLKSIKKLIDIVDNLGGKLLTSDFSEVKGIYKVQCRICGKTKTISGINLFTHSRIKQEHRAMPRAILSNGFCSKACFSYFKENKELFQKPFNKTLLMNIFKNSRVNHKIPKN